MQLAEYLETRGLTPYRLAKMWGVHPSTITRVMKGDRFPGPLVLVRVHELTGGAVGLGDWIETCRDTLNAQGILTPPADDQEKPKDV